MLTAAQNGAIEVSASRYGGFEQVGSLPQSFSRNDVQTTTQSGDIVLYSGNQLVIFFGSNSWSYTRLGHIEGLSTDELTVLLDKDIVFIEIKTTKKVFLTSSRANGICVPLALFYHRIGSAPRDSMLLPSAPRLRRYAVSAARSR